jgi:hypothetical protein
MPISGKNEKMTIFGSIVKYFESLQAVKKYKPTVFQLL